MQNAATAELDTMLNPGTRELEMLREIARFQGPGAVLADLPGYDLEPVYELAELELVTIKLEPLGTFAHCDGTENWGNVAHVTEEGLAELVIHGRVR